MKIAFHPRGDGVAVVGQVTGDGGIASLIGVAGSIAIVRAIRIDRPETFRVAHEIGFLPVTGINRSHGVGLGKVVHFPRVKPGRGEKPPAGDV